MQLKKPTKADILPFSYCEYRFSLHPSPGWVAKEAPPVVKKNSNQPRPGSNQQLLSERDTHSTIDANVFSLIMLILREADVRVIGGGGESTIKINEYLPDEPPSVV